MDMEIQVFCARRKNHLEHEYPVFYSQLIRDRALNKYIDNFALQCEETVKNHHEWFQCKVHKGTWTNPISMEVANEYRAILESLILPLITAPPHTL